MLTLAALCTAYEFDLEEVGEVELARCETKIDAIRDKHLSKPRTGPLPGGDGSPLKLCKDCAFFLSPGSGMFLCQHPGIGEWKNTDPVTGKTLCRMCYDMRGFIEQDGDYKQTAGGYCGPEAKLWKKKGLGC